MNMFLGGTYPIAKLTKIAIKTTQLRKNVKNFLPMTFLLADCFAKFAVDEEVFYYAKIT